MEGQKERKNVTNESTMKEKKQDYFMKRCINTPLTNLLDAFFSQILFSAGKIMRADQDCCRTFVRIRISFIKRKTYKSILHSSKEINMTISCIRNCYVLKLFVLLTSWTLTLLQTAGQLVCRLDLKLGLLMFPHDQVQVLPLWEKYHRNGAIYSSYIGDTGFQFVPLLMMFNLIT